MSILSVPEFQLAEADIYQAMAQGKDRIHKRVRETVLQMRERALELIEGKCVWGRIWTIAIFAICVERFIINLSYIELFR